MGLLHIDIRGSVSKVTSHTVVAQQQRIYCYGNHRRNRSIRMAMASVAHGYEAPASSREVDVTASQTISHCCVKWTFHPDSVTERKKTIVWLLSLPQCLSLYPSAASLTKIKGCLATSCEHQQSTFQSTPVTTYKALSSEVR